MNFTTILFNLSNNPKLAVLHYTDNEYLLQELYFDYAHDIDHGKITTVLYEETLVQDFIFYKIGHILKIS